jgi:hypothetical protein
MKCKKMIALLLLITSVLMLTAGCNRTYDYSFAQNLDNVEKVEIRAYEYDPYDDKTTPIVTLGEEDGKALLMEIDAMECMRHFGDHTSTYGEIVVYITYKDQTAEVIGLRNVAQVDKDEEWHIGIEYFDAAQLCTLIMKYVDEDLLPDLSKYFD